MWQKVLTLLKSEIELTYFTRYIHPLNVKPNTKDELVLECPSLVVKNKIEEKYIKLIESKVKDINGKKLPIKLVVTLNSQDKKPPTIDYSVNLHNENSLIESELSMKYEFRYDIIFGVVEYRYKNSDSDFAVVTDRDFNNIYRELLKNPKFKFVKTQTLSISLNSGFVPEYNPITDYIKSLKGKWKKGDRNYVGEVINCFKFSNKLNVEHYFNKFFRRVIHSALVPSFVNEHCFLLHSNVQGYGKTVFWTNLLPPALNPRFFNSQKLCDFRGIDALVLASQILLWNMDEIEGIVRNVADSEAFRSFLSNTGATARKAYGKSNERFNRVASVVATGNKEYPLLDPSGNRRFIAVTAIQELDFKKYFDIPKELFLAQVYNQYLATSPDDLHWTRKEQDEINANASNYERHFDDYELLLKHFTPCGTAEELNCAWLTSSEILNFLSSTYPRLSFSSIGIGRALTKAGFIKNKNTHFRSFVVQFKSNEAIYFFNADNADNADISKLVKDKV